MAEILLSLTIIGVVAAITLPSLTGNINERTWNTQRKALYSRMSQAVALMPSLNGYGTLKEASSAGASDAEDTAAETFVTDGLAKVLKINNICDSEHLAECGIPSKFTTMTASLVSPFPPDMKTLNASMVLADINVNDNPGVDFYSQINTKAAAFETQNGESIALYYNPYCVADLGSTDNMVPIQSNVCANFVYDLNGAKGPNTVGKDIGFITVLYPTDSLIGSPLPHVKASLSRVSSEEAVEYCSSLSNEYRIPNKEEAVSMFVNKKLIGNMGNSWILTSSKGLDNSGQVAVWTLSMFSGNRVLISTSGVDSGCGARCVKR